MPRTVPSYRQRNGSDQALVTLMDAVTRERRDYWLGTHGTSESRERYHRLIARWESQGRTLPPPEDAPAGAGSITLGGIDLRDLRRLWDWRRSPTQQVYPACSRNPKRTKVTLGTSPGWACNCATRSCTPKPPSACRQS